MRIIAIGLGGAGCRIADSLYATDRRSSKVACVQVLAIDVDEKSMQQLGAIPENAKMCFSALEPGTPDSSGEHSQTATIDIGEIISRIQNFESGETDAIFFCCGLGGSMVDVAPHVIAGLRSSIIEPIFGLVTLPCLAEGERISGKAADDIEMLSTLLDGIILFDNETWYKKIRSEKAHLMPKEKGFAEKMGFKKTEKILSPAQATYSLLNEAIVRRISLILRAGEFKADGGIDLAEVVLDSGEVLNTMKGMGFITIGYAVERLPHDPLSFLSRWKPAGLFDEDQKKKASRIVELAKQAIYHEISTPCDLTSAHKALILVAGPSHELSMKGYMTVRKWIDRSIAGLETRSGDYPVMNTKNVAIIIMLSGLENIPRITELKEIRSQHNPRQQTSPEEVQNPDVGGNEPGSGPVASPEKSKDEMIVLREPKSRDREFGDRSSARSSPQKTVQHHGGVHIPEIFEPDTYDIPRKPHATDPGREQKITDTLPIGYVPSPEDSSWPVSTGNSEPAAENPPAIKRRVIVAHEQKNPVHPHVSHQAPVSGSGPNRKTIADAAHHVSESSNVRLPGDNGIRAKDTERQRIERELQRQRMVAISGLTSKTGSRSAKSTAPEAGDDQQGIHKMIPLTEESRQKDGPDSSPAGVEKRTIIRSKRTVNVSSQDIHEPDNEKTAEKGYPDQRITTARRPAENIRGSDDGMSIGIRDPVFRAKDAVFKGKGIQRSPLPPARDSTLIHTDLKSKKKTDHANTGEPDISPVNPSSESQPLPKKRDGSDPKDNELSWI
jgi:cell division GTPase FtsZ